MKFTRPSMLLGLMAAAAALSLGLHMEAAIASADTAAAKEKSAPPPAKAPATRMGAMLADDIAKRDAQKKAEARTADLREQAAKAAQARLDAALKAKQQQNTPSDKTASPDAKPKSKDSEAPDQYEALARIFQAMKPAKAAPVFEQLDLGVQTRVARNMRERSTALIMASMTPRGAARLSMALAGNKESLPAEAKPATPVKAGK